MSLQKYKEKLERGQLLTEKEVENLAETAIAVLIQEPNVLELEGRQYVVGDVHGQFYDFLKMMKEVGTFWLN